MGFRAARFRVLGRRICALQSTNKLLLGLWDLGGLIYIYIYIHIHTPTQTVHVHIYIYIHTYIHVYIYIYILCVI